MTQREYAPPPLPECPQGHKPRYMLGGRRLEAKGGHFIQRGCCQTAKHASFDETWAPWRKKHSMQAAVEAPAVPMPTSELQLWLKGSVG